MEEMKGALPLAQTLARSKGMNNLLILAGSLGQPTESHTLPAGNPAPPSEIPEARKYVAVALQAYQKAKGRLLEQLSRLMVCSQVLV
jgi:hypothetical protein